MTPFNYGPVEVFVIEFAGDRPDPGVLAAISDLSDGGQIRLLDFVIGSRGADGELTLTEVVADDAPAEPGLELGLPGILSDQDVTEAFAAAQTGLSVAVVAFELRWATTLAERLTAANGTVVRSERIPAAAVNQLLRDVAFVAPEIGE